MTMSYYSPITYQVPPSEDGWLLKTILQKRMDVSRKLLSRLKMTEQGIMLNGERVYISVRVYAGDTVQIRMEQETSEDILPQPLPFEILYEDEHLLVVNKAAGMIVHPTHGHYTDTLANGVVYYWAQKGEQFRFRPVHRLDQETSGVLVIAKNPYSHQHISEQMIAGTVDKRYHAWVHGVPAALSGDIDGPIDRDPAEPHRRIVTPDGYPSLTRYEVKEVYSGAAKVELKLESGRTHQIRVHMGSIGCPLIGDGMYRHPLYSKAGLSAEEPGDPVPVKPAQLRRTAELEAGERAQLERAAELEAVELEAGERAQLERTAELEAGERAQLERIAELEAGERAQLELGAGEWAQLERIAELGAGERAQLERIAELEAGERAQLELGAGEWAQLERIAELDASIPRQALHAVRLSFQHPVLRTELVFEAPLPPDLALLQAKLQRETAVAEPPGSDRNQR